MVKYNYSLQILYNLEYLFATMVTVCFKIVFQLKKN